MKLFLSQKTNKARTHTQMYRHTQQDWPGVPVFFAGGDFFVYFPSCCTPDLISLEAFTHCKLCFSTISELERLRSLDVLLHSQQVCTNVHQRHDEPHRMHPFLERFCWQIFNSLFKLCNKLKLLVQQIHFFFSFFWRSVKSDLRSFWLDLLRLCLIMNLGCACVCILRH